MSFHWETSGSNGPSQMSTGDAAVSSVSVRSGDLSDPWPAGICGGLSATINSAEATPFRALPGGGGCPHTSLGFADLGAVLEVVLENLRG